MGTMVAIDYNDGSASLVAGLEETLLELGIVAAQVVQDDKESVTSSTNSNDDNSIVTSVDVVSETTVPVPVVTFVPTSSTPDSSATNTLPVAAATITKTPSLQGASSNNNKKESSDARDRMRAQAATDKAVNNNPWASMAGYLAKKAGEKMFGEGK